MKYEKGRKNVAGGRNGKVEDEVMFTTSFLWALWIGFNSFG